MNETRDNRQPSRHTTDRRVDEVQKRGGYLAPASPFSLPAMPAGPAQGAQTDSESTTPTGPDSSSNTAD
jgi:hypothetical protein